MATLLLTLHLYRYFYDHVGTGCLPQCIGQVNDFYARLGVIQLVDEVNAVGGEFHTEGLMPGGGSAFELSRFLSAYAIIGDFDVK